jgi:hypothetical protein
MRGRCPCSASRPIGRFRPQMGALVAGTPLAIEYSGLMRAITYHPFPQAPFKPVRFHASLEARYADATVVRSGKGQTGGPTVAAPASGGAGPVQAV